MLPAVVVIDLEPTPSIEAAAVLVDRCSQVVASSGTGGCALDTPALEQSTEQATQPDDPLRDEAPWLVRVQWSGATLQNAQIVLFHSAAPLEPLRRRELSFSSDSPEQDRWESVGLLVAALVVSERAAPPPAPEPEPAEPEPAPLPKPEVTEPTSANAAHLAIAGWVGSALKASTPQFGINLRGDFDFAAVPIRPLLQVSYGYASDVIKLHSAMLEVGLGVPWKNPGLELEPYATLSGQLNRAQISQGTAKDAATRSRWGGSLGLNAYPRLDSTWSVWLGAEATLLTPRMIFEVQSQPAGQLHPLNWRGFLGLRAAL